MTELQWDLILQFFILFIVIAVMFRMFLGVILKDIVDYRANKKISDSLSLDLTKSVTDDAARTKLVEGSRHEL